MYENPNLKLNWKIGDPVYPMERHGLTVLRLPIMTDNGHHVVKDAKHCFCTKEAAIAARNVHIAKLAKELETQLKTPAAVLQFLYAPITKAWPTPKNIAIDTVIRKKAVELFGIELVPGDMATQYKQNTDQGD